jgi:hypothetical protein
MVEAEPVSEVRFEKKTYANGQCPKHILVVIHHLQKPFKLSRVKFTLTKLPPVLKRVQKCLAEVIHLMFFCANKQYVKL